MGGCLLHSYCFLLLSYQNIITEAHLDGGVSTCTIAMPMVFNRVFLVEGGRAMGIGIGVGIGVGNRVFLVEGGSLGAS